MLDILYQDRELIAVQKPAGRLVHKTDLAADRTACLQEVRNQINRYLYPIHRLDRGTSGVLLYALSSSMATNMRELFDQRKIEKKYIALVRGHLEPSGCIDSTLRHKDGIQRVEALTLYKTLSKIEISAAIGPYPTARYSMIECQPRSGRNHQIRRHLVKISHPIIGDRQYGDNHHNNYFRDKIKIKRLFLFATEIKFIHPISKKTVIIQSPLSNHIRKFLKKLGLKDEKVLGK